MTEESKGRAVPRPVAKFTPADVDRWFSANEARDECPVCKTTNWLILAGEDVGALSLGIVAWNGLLDQSRHFRALTLICEKCAYLRLHHLNTFMQWLEKNPPETHDGNAS